MTATTMTATCAPTELLSMLRGSRCSICASLKLQYLLQESSCSMCSNRDTPCAPRKPLLHVLQHFSLCSSGAGIGYLLPESRCSMYSSGATYCICSQKLAKNNGHELKSISRPMPHCSFVITINQNILSQTYVYAIVSNTTVKIVIK